MRENKLKKNIEVLHVLFLIGPAYLRLIFPESIEVSLTHQVFGYSLFLPQLLYCFLPIVTLHKRTKIIVNGKLLSLAVFGVAFGFFAAVNGNSHLIINNFLAGTDFYLHLFLFVLFPIDAAQLKTVYRCTLVVWVIISLEIVLYSFGILTYSKQLGNDFSYGGINRISTTIAGSTGTAVAYFILAMINYALAKKRNIKDGVLFLSFGVIMVTLTRSVIIAFLIVFYYWYRMRNIKVLRINFYIKFAFVSLLAFVTLNSLGLLDSLKSRDEALSYGEVDISNGRFERWAKSYEFIKEYPILGTGANFVTMHKRARLANVDSLNAFSPHNTYILVLMERGIVGFLLFILVLGFLYYEIRGRNGLSKIGFVIAVLLLMNTEIVFVFSEFATLFLLLWSTTKIKSAPHNYAKNYTQ